MKNVSGVELFYNDESQFEKYLGSKCSLGTLQLKCS